ncbi:MAG: hypothetical protein ABII09_05400 [Planctomycetota bacterium]
MRYIWRRVLGRCPRCGQRLNGYKTTSERVCEINSRASRLTGELGRTPLAQNCSQCNRLIFEGESGFVQRYLLVDILDWRPTCDGSAQNHGLQKHV